MRNIQTVAHGRRRGLAVATLAPVFTVLLLGSAAVLSGAALATTGEEPPCDEPLPLCDGPPGQGPPGDAPPGDVPPFEEPPGEDPPTPAVTTCTVTVTLVDMLVIKDTGPHEDKWRIKTSGHPAGHDDTGDRLLGGDQGEVVLINRRVGTSTIPKTAFPMSASLHVDVTNVGTIFRYPEESHETYELDCPQNREEHVVVVKEGTNETTIFEVVLKYRYRVTED